MAYPYGAYSAAAAVTAAPVIDVDYGPFFKEIGVKSWSAGRDGQLILVFETAAEVDRMRTRISSQVPRSCANELERVDAEYGQASCYANTAKLSLQFTTRNGADDCILALEKMANIGQFFKTHERIVRIDVSGTGDGSTGFEHVEQVFTNLKPLLGAKLESLRKFTAQPPSNYVAPPDYKGAGSYTGGNGSYTG